MTCWEVVFPLTTAYNNIYRGRVRDGRSVVYKILYYIMWVFVLSCWGRYTSFIAAAAAAVDAAKTAKIGRDHATASSFCPEKTWRQYNNNNNNEGFIICYFVVILQSWPQHAGRAYMIFYIMLACCRYRERGIRYIPYTMYRCTII